MIYRENSSIENQRNNYETLSRYAVTLKPFHLLLIRKLEQQREIIQVQPYNSILTFFCILRMYYVRDGTIESIFYNVTSMKSNI